MWMSSNWRRAFSLGLVSSSEKTTKGKKAPPSSFLDSALAPYVYHLAGMTAIALLMMHVNVATRFLSSSPALYWGAAVLLLKNTTKKREKNHRLGVVSLVSTHWIWLWAMLSAVLGCLLFPNFFPWT
jgi:phosphatidylinositol glycan class V